MKIAIHHRPDSFSERWIDYCKENGIPYILVNAYSSDIISQVHDCDVFMWHYHHAEFKDMLFAKELLFSLEIAGKRVFPSFHTGWFFDDKIAQMYLLQAIGAPLVPSYVFYSKSEAIQWVQNATFPKVLKLRCGAGAMNVRLVSTRKEAIGFIDKLFKSGLTQINRLNDLKERIRKYRNREIDFFSLCKGFGRFLVPMKYVKMQKAEKGYAYFQEYIRGNEFDIRVIVIGDKAFSIKRLVREKDFRASGSGKIIYTREELDETCVKLSFKVNAFIRSQCIAYDFIYDENGNPLIVELSHGFSMHGYDACPGYWTSDLVWHEEKFNPQYWLIKDVINNK